MTNKEIYAELCEKDESINLFQQSWWLNAVCAGKEWDVLLSRDEQGEIQAAMPYLLRKRRPFSYVIMPQQTQIAGIWLRPDKADDAEAVNRIADEFTAQLHRLRLSYYCQNFPIGSPFPEVLASKGFHIKERQTYRLEDLSDLDKIIDSFSKNKKRQLQKALALHLDTDMSEEDFYRFHKECLEAKKKKISYTREFFLVLSRKSMKREQGKILAIRDAEGNTHAAVFVVWDKESLYYLIPAINPDFSDSGAGALLALEAIKLARQVSRSFDFEGSMIRGVANHYRQFGTTRQTYYQVYKTYNALFSVPMFFYRMFN